MITPSYGVTATERVLPRLALDFTTAVLDPRITFTRTTGASNPATYVNSSGYITEATNNQPRFDYDPVTLACKGLLIEEPRTNVRTYSNNFLNTATAGETRPWVWSNVTAVSVSKTAPDGTSSCFKVTEDTANTTHFIYASASGTSGTIYCFSYFVKADGRSKVKIDPNDGTFGSNLSVTFDLAAETATPLGTPAGYGIVKYKDGWFRCWAAFTATATASALAPLYLMSGNDTTYQGDGTSGVLVYGHQLETGAFPTSYIPTVTAALTRNADVTTMSATNFSSWFNASEGSFEIDFNPYYVGALDSTQVIMEISDGTTTNVLSLYKRSNAASDVLYVADVASSREASINIGTLTTGNNKTTIAYKLNSYAACKNAATVGTDTAVGVPTVDRLILGTNRITNTLAIKGHLQRVKYWPQRLTNAEIQAFSK
jgi:hypothetical protein